MLLFHVLSYFNTLIQYHTLGRIRISVDKTDMTNIFGHTSKVLTKIPCAVGINNSYIKYKM